jgi:hypothetical protein
MAVERSVGNGRDAGIGYGADACFACFGIPEDIRVGSGGGVVGCLQVF